MRIRTLVGLGAALCAAALLGLPHTDTRAEDGGAVKLVGDAGPVKALIGKDTDDLLKALSAAKPEKKDLKRARMLAVVIALNGKALGTPEGKAAAEQATKVAVALAGDDGLADAKKAAVALKTAKKPTGAGGGDVIKTLFDEDPSVKDWDRDLTMQLFKTPRAGGLGIEKKVKDWSEKAPVGVEVKLAAEYAQKIGVIAQALEHMTAPKTKNVPNWTKYAQNMQAAAAEAIEAAKDGNGKKMMNAFSRVDKACTVCHELAK